MSLINNTQKVKVKCSQDLDFVSIVQDSKPEAEIWEWEIVFFCKDCKDVVEVKKEKNKTVCAVCWSKKVSRWFEPSIKNYYKI